MKIEFELSDEAVEELATAIASKISVNGTAPEGDDDDFDGGGSVEVTLENVQDAIKEAVGKHGKDKIKSLVKKIAGVEKVADVPKEKYQPILDGLKKVK